MEDERIIDLAFKNKASLLITILLWIKILVN
jgi:hypothetical protein